MSSSEFRDVYGFGVTLGSLYIEAQGYVPVLLENLHGMCFSGTCFLLLLLLLSHFSCVRLCATP